LVETKRFFEGRARLYQVVTCADSRGILVPIEFSSIPFRPNRFFFVHGVPAGSSRGGHAHRSGQQLLIHISGEVLVELRFESEEHHVTLFEDGQALLIGPRVWSKQTYATAGAGLCVLASQSYRQDSYITET
jgi:hypothetical protein